MEFLSNQKAEQLTKLAETARINLSKLSDSDVQYNAEGLSMLDEWIDRHMKQYHQPSAELKTIWSAFLGEAILRKFNGKWGLNPDQNPPLGVICTSENSKPLFVDVHAQIQRRIQNGIQSSLVYYYTMKGIEINMM